MLHRLPIYLAHVKAGNTPENLLSSMFSVSSKSNY